jgi:hypothetical protein
LSRLERPTIRIFLVESAALLERLSTIEEERTGTPRPRRPFWPSRFPVAPESLWVSSSCPQDANASGKFTARRVGYRPRNGFETMRPRFPGEPSAAPRSIRQPERRRSVSRSKHGRRAPTDRLLEATTLRTASEASLLPRALGGGGGIRTPGTLPGTAVFKTAALNHSATPPEDVSLGQHLAGRHGGGPPLEPGFLLEPAGPQGEAPSGGVTGTDAFVSTAHDGGATGALASRLQAAS